MQLAGAFFEYHFKSLAAFTGSVNAPEVNRDDGEQADYDDDQL
jgi:hypothetical protein